MSGKLSRSQRLAIEHITEYARSRKNEAQAALKQIFQMSNIPWHTYGEVTKRIFEHARVALHFHPDRPVMDMKSVAQALLEQGIYKSQFETHISNGSVSAYPGGVRDLWEKNLFGGAYHLEETVDSHRPKYGALDLMQHPDGPAPRFGSCYFLLSPKASHRCTFTYLDSHEEPKEKGTYREFDDILAALFKDAFLRNDAIGTKDLTPKGMINHLQNNLVRPFQDPSTREASRNLNYYIEAQVHGDISLMEDVDLLVADSSFKGKAIGEVLERLCFKYSIALHWHKGFTMTAKDIPSDFRGPSMPSLARRIASNNNVDASIIGEAVFDLKRNPALWNDRGREDEVLQELKYMWHILVQYGSPVL